MFGFLKKKEENELSPSFIKMLNEIDLCYMEAYGLQSTRHIARYLSRDALDDIIPLIHSVGGKYFGTPKFRNTQWIKQSEEDGVITVLKDVKFDKVKIGVGLSIGVAENYCETWVVDTKLKEHQVLAIFEVDKGQTIYG